MLSLFNPFVRTPTAYQKDLFDFFDFPLSQRFENDVQFHQYEKDGKHFVEAQLPEQIGKEDVNIHMKSDDQGNKWLDVVIQHESTENSEDGKSYQKSSSRIQRSFAFDENTYDVKNMKASLNNNTLRIAIPLNQVEEPSEEDEIEIEFEE